MADVEVRELRDNNGHRIGEAEYVDGKLHGTSRIWTPRGVLIQESQFVNGEHHGSYRTWWDNGTPKEVGTFLAGNRVGRYFWYSEQGNLIREHDYGGKK